jgi:hypothetical protein
MHHSSRTTGISTIHSLGTMLRRTLLSHPNARSFSSCRLSFDERVAGGLRFHSCKTPLQSPLSATSLILRGRLISTLPCVNFGNHYYNGIQYTQSRSFFFGSSGSGNNNDDDDDGKGKGEKDKKDKDKDKKDDDESGNKEDDTTDEKGASSDDSAPSPSLNNSSKYKKSTRSSPTSTLPSNVLVPASRLGFGDQAPRYPHLLALPVIRGPVFPGVLVGR